MIVINDCYMIFGNEILEVDCVLLRLLVCTQLVGAAVEEAAVEHVMVWVDGYCFAGRAALKPI